MKTNTRNKVIVVLAILVGMISQPVLQAVERDGEVVLNVKELKASIEEATSPLSNRISSSQLMEKFDRVNQCLDEKELNKGSLLGALEELRDEMNSFTDNWSEITDPLWRGQDALAGTIEKIRLMLARVNTGEPAEKVKKSLKNYDKRLSNMAQTIKNEKNEERKQRLKMVFANILGLRKLTEQAGMIDLGPAQQSVYVKIIESLSNLEMQLTNSTFALEKTRILLEGQSEFVNTYVDILGGLIEAEELSKVLAQMSNAGDGFAVLGGELDKVNSSIEAFGGKINTLSEKLADNINKNASQSGPAFEYDEQEVDRAIEKYISK